MSPQIVRAALFFFCASGGIRQPQTPYGQDNPSVCPWQTASFAQRSLGKGVKGQCPLRVQGGARKRPHKSKPTVCALPRKRSMRGGGYSFKSGETRYKGTSCTLAGVRLGHVPLCTLPSPKLPGSDTICTPSPRFDGNGFARQSETRIRARQSLSHAAHDSSLCTKEP